MWCRRPDVRVRDGFEVCFVLVACISKQLMLLFRSLQKAKTTLNHTMFKYVLYESFSIISQYVYFAAHVILLADIHAICK